MYIFPIVLTSINKDDITVLSKANWVKGTLIRLVIHASGVFTFTFENDHGVIVNVPVTMPPEMLYMLGLDVVTMPDQKVVYPMTERSEKPMDYWLMRNELLPDSDIVTMKLLTESVSSSSTALEFTIPKKALEDVNWHVTRSKYGQSNPIMGA